MTNRTFAAPQLILLLSALALALLAHQIMSPAAVNAHGDGLEIVREESGPFEIGFRILPFDPRVGQIHVTATVDSLATGEEIHDAVVRITTRLSEDPTVAYTSFAVNAVNDPRWYDANFDLDHHGTWDFTVEVRASEGEGQIEVPVIVAKRNRNDGAGPTGTAVFGVATLVIVAGGVWIGYSGRKNRRRHGRSG